MEITLTPLHWVYLIGTIFVITAMVMKKDVVLPCMVFTMLSGLIASGNPAEALLTEEIPLVSISVTNCSASSRPSACFLSFFGPYGSLFPES